MDRRRFLTTAGAAVMSGPAGATQKQPQSPKVQMKLGCQSGGPQPDERLRFFQRHGVAHICGQPPAPANGGGWTAEELARMRERCEKHGIVLAMIPLPFLESSHVDRTKRAAIVLGRSPERDRDIEDIHKMIRACQQAGIPAIKYNLSILGVLRTAPAEGRGSAAYSAWKLAEAKPQPALTRAGRVTAEIFWERITYFLDRVIPVANEYKIRMACHPHDPGVPPSGFQGVDRVLGTVDGLKRFVSIRESAYHGLNFCQGTVSEMLRDPAREIGDVIRYFGQRKKIFNVHFRNIRGARDNFRETYPDDGDVNMPQAMRTYAEVGYDGMIMPDHVPRHPEDPGGLQAFAFAYGYIRALLQKVTSDE